MKLNDDFGELNKSKTYVFTAIIAVISITAIILIVLFLNSKELKRKLSVSSASVSSETSVSSIDVYTSTSLNFSDITVSDLDFYEMYQDKEDTAGDDSASDTEETVSSVSADSDSTPVIDETNDGKHTLIEYLDGKTEWIPISPYITKHSYDYTNLFNQSGKFKYYEDEVLVSRFGIDISQDEDYIDFNKVKKAGVDFVMIRAGVRGYQSGQITEDKYYSDNLKRALDAGLDVGIYFISNAITEEEAIEEANLIIASVGERKITYPIAFVMDYQNNDVSRIDSVSRNDKTMIARAFLNTIKAAGFKPIVYGRKEWLIKELDLSKLVGDFDMWLTMTDVDLPDYPYKFSMWQYNKKGTIDGVSGVVNFDISFIDYALK